MVGPLYGVNGRNIAVLVPFSYVLPVEFCEASGKSVHFLSTEKGDCSCYTCTILHVFGFSGIIISGVQPDLSSLIYLYTTGIECRFWYIYPMGTSCLYSCFQKLLTLPEHLSAPTPDL